METLHSHNLGYLINKDSIYGECEPGSSVSMVSGYGLDDRAIEGPYSGYRGSFLRG
jgi:hypothetical protein